MSNISILLDYNKWDKNTYRWYLPISSISSDKTRLWINDKEIVAGAFVVKNNFLEILDKSLVINGDDRVTADLSLTKAATLSPFFQSIVMAFIAIIPAFLTFFATMSFKTTDVKPIVAEKTDLPLVAYPDYPVVLTADNGLAFNKQNFIVNVNRFLNEDNVKAASDLIYMGQSNNVQLNKNESDNYKKLIKAYKFTEYDNLEEYRKELFSNSEQIMNAVGDMFRDSKIEFVLHDARDPFHSVVAIKNNMTDRRIGSPATHLGIKLIRHYSATNLGVPPLISYKLNYKDRAFKASTIPLYDKKIGLYGFICINFDITDLSISPSIPYRETFINNITRVELSDLAEELAR